MAREIDRIDRPIERGASEQVLRKRLVLRPGAYEAQSPFLSLAEDWFAAPGGFETHPHRGMQTVTLVLEGALRHRDHTGGDGILGPGDVQWMTAGRGVLHSEMPHGGASVHSLQLWLNLPAAAKMIPSRYVDQPLAAVPMRRAAGGQARVYAGRSGEVAHRHGSDWPLVFVDIEIAAGGRFEQEMPASYRGFLYFLAGSARIGADRVTAPDVAWFEPGAGDSIAINADAPCRCLFFASPPIDEPVVAYGPFVMNTLDEIRQAFADYQANRLTG